MWDRRPMAEYIRDGWTISTTMAIDFCEKAEHSIGGSGQTETEKALASIGRILAPFDY